MDLGRALKVAADTGEVTFGVRQALRAAEAGSNVLFVVAQDCPVEGDLRARGARVLPFPGGSLELGAACGQPFGVSVVAVLDPGDSSILNL